MKNTVNKHIVLLLVLVLSMTMMILVSCKKAEDTGAADAGQKQSETGNGDKEESLQNDDAGENGGEASKRMRRMRRQRFPMSPLMKSG
ncbi:MAG: hypothetical protein K6F86_09275 [Lachnospiraceae bacterium]|nr:hypothetical protein [Lachnospiraceae bacterium]